MSDLSTQRAGKEKGAGVEVCLYVAVGEVGWVSRYVPPPDFEMPGTARNIKVGADRLSCQRSNSTVDAARFCSVVTAVRVV